MDRRSFIGRAARLGGAAALGAAGLSACDDRRDSTAERALSVPRLLDGKPGDAPIDTVVIVMMENRSFDHYLGWLPDDLAYLEAGRRSYGRRFHVAGENDLVYADPAGTLVNTAPVPAEPDEPRPFRGCDHPIPGHGWFSGRAQRDKGFLAEGTGNDEFAIGYYSDVDLPFYSQLARRFTVADQSYASLLAGTFPNRQYLHAGTSLGRKDDPIPLEAGLFPGPTFWDQLRAAGVSARYYYTDLPVLALWDTRHFDRISSIDEFFDDADRGELPHVVMIDPGFGGNARSDDHPFGSIRMGQRFTRSVFDAFARSSHWEQGLFVLTYDEWGGFFDHLSPPVFPDDLASELDAENFAQAGFRVPTIFASPYAQPGFVDHTAYDHTSIMRFLQWRFLGAPATGPGLTSGAPWWLTLRNRYANNLGTALVTEPRVDLGFDVETPLARPQPGCVPTIVGGDDPGSIPNGPQLAGLRAERFLPATETPWI